jgi:predicted SpoU family rRNA methylase
LLTEINENFQSIAVQLLKGTRTSHATYNEHRFLESFESQIDANKRKKLIGTHRRTVPKYMDCKEIVDLLKTLVDNSGGGYKVQTERLWTSIAQQMAKTFENKDQRITKTLQQNNANQLVKEIYIKRSELFNRLNEIKEVIIAYGGIEEVDSKNYWQQICSQLTFNQLDATWLLQQVCKYTFPQYSPTKRAIRRRQKRLSTGQLMPTKPVISIVKKQLHELLFGKLQSDGKPEYSDEELIQLFEKGKLYIGYEEVLYSYSNKLKRNIDFPVRIMDIRTLLIQKVISLFKVFIFVKQFLFILVRMFSSRYCLIFYIISWRLD